MNNLIKRVADRHEKTARIPEIEGKWKRVSPLIGTWFENLITKLGSLQDSMAYAEKIADKEFKRIENLVKRKYGKTDNWEDDEYEDPLVQAYYWIDDFWGQVRSGRYAELNKFQRKIEEAKTALEETIYDVNSWGSHATRLASETKEAAIYRDNALKNLVSFLVKAYTRNKPSRPEYQQIGNSEGYGLTIGRDADKEAKRIANVFLKVLKRIGDKDFFQDKTYSDDYETSIIFTKKPNENGQGMKVQIILDNRKNDMGEFLKDRFQVYIWEE
jgi:hypothetical protein